MGSSDYDLFDYDVPFYELVIQGYIPYASRPLNAAADSSELRMLSLSTAAAPHYEFIYNSSKNFRDSYYDRLFYAKYNGWTDIAAEDYSLYEVAAGGLSDKTITAYATNGRNVRRTTFSDGTTIEVDTETKQIWLDGAEISLYSYLF